MSRASSPGIRLDDESAALAKGMMMRGDRHSDIAAWFSINGGRIGELSTGDAWAHIDPAPEDFLPPAGPYLTVQGPNGAKSSVAEVRAQLDVLASKLDKILEKQNQS